MNTFEQTIKGEKIIRFKRVFIETFKDLPKEKRAVIEVELPNGGKQTILVEVL
jgi:hypothetical protein